MREHLVCLRTYFFLMASGLNLFHKEYSVFYQIGPLWVTKKGLQYPDWNISEGNIAVYSRQLFHVM